MLVMPQQRKNPLKPQKMNNFFTVRGPQQNGNGAWRKLPEQQATISANGHSRPHQQLLANMLHSGSSSGTSSPSTRSPAKQKQRIASPDGPLMDPDMEVSGPTNTGTTTLHNLQDPIATFPTSDRLVSDTVLKEMFLSLKASLHANMIAGINHCQGEVRAIGGRVDHIKKQMSEYTSSFNTMLDAHSNHSEEIAWLKNTVADLEGSEGTTSK